ncbi:MAG: septation protein SpoVG family protein [Candidatus Omnitrophota bacterium]|jgi:DNA-binding cell septation regulator SpoVG
MSELVVSEIQIIPVKPKDGLVSFASCVINNQLYLGNIAIYSSLSSPDGFRLVYPSRAANGTQLSIAHPITKEAGLAIQKQIVERYIKLMEDLTKGDSANGREPPNS